MNIKIETIKWKFRFFSNTKYTKKQPNNIQFFDLSLIGKTTYNSVDEKVRTEFVALNHEQIHITQHTGHAKIHNLKQNSWLSLVNISNQQKDSNRKPQYSNQNDLSNEGLQRQSAKQKGYKLHLTKNQIAKTHSMINKLFLRQSVNANMKNEGAYEAVEVVDEMQHATCSTKWWCRVAGRSPWKFLFIFSFWSWIRRRQWSTAGSIRRGRGEWNSWQEKSNF